MKPFHNPQPAFGLTHYALCPVLCSLALALALAPVALRAQDAASEARMFYVDFEKGMPANASASDADTTIVTNRARSGSASLRLAKKSGARFGSLVFNLDGIDRIGDISKGFEFSVWIYVDKHATFTLPVTAEDRHGEKYTVCNAHEILTPGAWHNLTGLVQPGEWPKAHRNFKLTISTSDVCWIDDLVMRVGGLPEPPSQVWPGLKESLHTAAGARASTLAPGASLTLDSRHAALAPDLALLKVLPPDGAAAPTVNRKPETVNIPPDGLLVFAIDATDDLNLTGTLHLTPDSNLRPCLRATVLCDDTVIGAPGVRANPWKTWINGVHVAPPNTRGFRPPSTVALAPFRMTKGRHYITIAGPHFRNGGTFVRLELKAADRPAESPLYSFGVFADTHIDYGRHTRGNIRINNRTAGELEAALRQLKSENATFAIIAGDMTQASSRGSYEQLAAAIGNAGLPVYGCPGNHDTEKRLSRQYIAELVPGLFPSGPENTDYVFNSPPLRFVVVDGSRWLDTDGNIHGTSSSAGGGKLTHRADFDNWMRATLAADTDTPTVIVSHYRYYHQGGVSDVSGCDLGTAQGAGGHVEIFTAAPNVIAALSGHHHYNAVTTRKGVSFIQNPGFHVWPNAYRVFRVYADRLEWEVRQIPNRGLIREGFVEKHAIAWELSTSEGDLSGVVNWPRERRKTK